MNEECAHKIILRRDEDGWVIDNCWCSKCNQPLDRGEYLQLERAINPRFVYVVIGQSGSYDDSSTWMVHAYLDEVRAQKHADDANNWIREARERIGEPHRYNPEVKIWPYDKMKKEQNPFDPYMRIADDDAAEYSVEAVELGG